MRNERSRPPTKETGPDNTNQGHRSSGPRQIDGAVSTPWAEPWVLDLRESIDAAIDARLRLWESLGLRLPPRGEEVFHRSRIHNAVDLAGRP